MFDLFKKKKKNRREGNDYSPIKSVEIPKTHEVSLNYNYNVEKAAGQNKN